MMSDMRQFTIGVMLQNIPPRTVTSRTASTVSQGSALMVKAVDLLRSESSQVYQDPLKIEVITSVPDSFAACPTLSPRPTHSITSAPPQAQNSYISAELQRLIL